MSDSPTLAQQLQVPFPAEQLKWRIAQTGRTRKGSWAQLRAYLDKSTVEQRFDEVFGPMGWACEYRPGPAGGLVCRILAISPEMALAAADVGDATWPKSWPYKEDGAENTDIESVKGGLSDAFKRAATRWGVGRYLYRLDSTFVWGVEGKDREAFLKWNTGSKSEPQWWSLHKRPELPGWAQP